MATLDQDVIREFELTGAETFEDVDAIADDIIYGGAAVGENASTGQGRPLVGGDNFLGFSEARCDNEGGAAGDETIRVRTKGRVQLEVTGVSGDANVGDTVYASDDDTFTTTSSGNSSIGKVARHVDGTKCVVAFEATFERSL